MSFVVATKLREVYFLNKKKESLRKWAAFLPEGVGPGVLVANKIRFEVNRKHVWRTLPIDPFLILTFSSIHFIF